MIQCDSKRKRARHSGHGGHRSRLPTLRHRLRLHERAFPRPDSEACHRRGEDGYQRRPVHYDEGTSNI
ncbi:hypothetical protein AVEN_183887-1 [Araneus ventricosus]|uniref:Uncharacterized protein n=1 Tax=Araneus ventricosus TaxID=182803 RepID=A0A4Y2TJ09_ARAVE|nr:hypothetical protein AVEN_183887-1 [Araneus ventricosus]